MLLLAAGCCSTTQRLKLPNGTKCSLVRALFRGRDITKAGRLPQFFGSSTAARITRRIPRTRTLTPAGSAQLFLCCASYRCGFRQHPPKCRSEARPLPSSSSRKVGYPTARPPATQSERRSTSNSAALQEPIPPRARARSSPTSMPVSLSRPPSSPPSALTAVTC